MGFVLLAIQLDRQLCFCAIQIHSIGTDRMLPPEPKAETITAKCLPHQGLCYGWFLAGSSRSFYCIDISIAGHLD